MSTEQRAEQVRNAEGCPHSSFVEARHIEVGDTIRWCGRLCEVTAIELAKPNGRESQRPGRKFTVMTENGHVAGLHWFYNEAVELLETRNGGPMPERADEDGMWLTTVEVEDLCRVAATEAATEALNGLRSLPVAQRMELMGMEREATDCPTHGVAWLKAHWCSCDEVTVLYREAPET